MPKWLILHNQKSINSQRLTNDDIVRILLKNRGITDEKNIQDFLYPSLDSINLKQLGLVKKKIDKAVKRIKKAIENKESVVVYTDYDVDGLTGGAIIWETLYEFGVKVMPYIPHRISEGYGLSKKGIDNVRKEFHPSLIITVDIGISAGKLVDYAKNQKIETIIIDHHLPPPKLPKAHAIVHTTKIAAGAIAWFFSCYLMSYLTGKQTNKFFPRDLDLAAMATIADMIPLIGVNRTIVKYGLKQLNQTKRIGLNALIKESSLNKGEIGTYEVGRILAPRINAMGRLTHAMDALRLICTRDKERAVQLAKTLGEVNKERQIITEETTNHAIKEVKVKLTHHLIFAAHEKYQQGVIGLVAGKLAEQFACPAIVVSRGEDFSKASARSVKGINILEIIRQSSKILIDVGGHPMAAGFTIATKNLDQFKKRTEKLLSLLIAGEDETKVFNIDMELNSDQVSMSLYEKIQTLSPFGIGNPEPIFLGRNLQIISASLVGKNKRHLKLTISKNTNIRNSTNPGSGHNYLGAIGFNLGEIFPYLTKEKGIDAVYSIEKDTWNGNGRLQLKLKDVKIPD